MRKKIIAKNLKHVFLEGGAFSRELFELDLEKRIAAYLQSKHEDGDKYLFVIAEKSNAIAMMLIDENNDVHVNEAARALLMKFRKGKNYKNNILLFMPDMANELRKGNHYFAGVKVVEGGAQERLVLTSSLVLVNDKPTRSEYTSSAHEKGWHRAKPASYQLERRRIGHVTRSSPTSPLKNILKVFFGLNGLELSVSRGRSLKTSCSENHLSCATVRRFCTLRHVHPTAVH